MIEPLHDRIVVIRAAEDEITAGGLIIPDAAKKEQARGKVIAVGDGRRDKDGQRIALDVQAGDEVLFGKYAGAQVEYDNQEYVVLREDDVLARIRERPTDAQE